MSVLVVGAGKIGQEYTDVLLALGEDPFVVTRGTRRATEMRNEYPSVTIRSGGLEQYIDSHDPPNRAILCTPVEALTSHCRLLLEASVGRVLSEKPLALSAARARDLHSLAEKRDASVFVAYNRRNYASVRRARELIADDGGVSSMTVDFTEAVFRISADDFPDRVLRRWGIANSSHVLDTAFSLAGTPKQLSASQWGDTVPWHPSGSIFTGTGVTRRDVPFSYHADWGCPGRWRLEVNTPERKLLFSPMERLKIQPKGTFDLTESKVDYSLDENFKPGFYRQTEQFLTEDADVLLELAELSNELAVLETVFGYDPDS
jgi:predicted dehydrogenase